MNGKARPMFAGLSLCAFVTILASSTAWAQAADEEGNEATVRAMTDAINARDLDRLDELVAADVVRHSPSTPGVVVESLDDFKAFLRADFAMVPDSKIECPIVVTEGDRVAVWCTYEGHQDGPMGPFPATGKSLKLEYASFLRFDESRKIAELYVVWDNLDALVQLGHVPPPGGQGEGEMWEGDRP